MQQLVQIQKYYEDTYLFQWPSTILETSKVLMQDGKKDDINVIRLLLKENIFHPQGGGQPDDEGYIKLNEEQFEVYSIFNDKNAQLVSLNFIYEQHLLDLLLQAKQENQIIVQIVNEQKRKSFSQLHSGGHFLDMAVKRLGFKWQPSKGYHFLEGSYVEYIGTIDGKAEEIQNKIQQQCDQLLKEIDAEDSKLIEYLNEQQLQQKLGEVPVYLKGAQNVRYVQLSKFDEGCPCGGTHVNHVREIGQIVIGKIQKKGKNVRVAYKIQ